MRARMVRRPATSRRSCDVFSGAMPLDVERHIKKHILHPKVRMAVLIKELLEFQDHLHNNLVVEDTATGLTAVDKGMVP